MGLLQWTPHLIHDTVIYQSSVTMKAAVKARIRFFRSILAAHASSEKQIVIAPVIQSGLFRRILAEVNCVVLFIGATTPKQKGYPHNLWITVFKIA